MGDKKGDMIDLTAEDSSSEDDDDCSRQNQDEKEDTTSSHCSSSSSASTAHSEILHEPFQIEVKGAKTHEVNGIYNQAGYYEGCRMYSKDGKWKKKGYKTCTFSIFQCQVDGNKYWYISIVPQGLEPGSKKDLDFYYAPVTSTCRRIPPLQGWVYESYGRQPEPTLSYHINDDDNNNIENIIPAKSTTITSVAVGEATCPGKAVASAAAGPAVDVAADSNQPSMGRVLKQRQQQQNGEFTINNKKESLTAQHPKQLSCSSNNEENQPYDMALLMKKNRLLQQENADLNIYAGSLLATSKRQQEDMESIQEKHDKLKDAFKSTVAAYERKHEQQEKENTNLVSKIKVLEQDKMGLVKRVAWLFTENKQQQEQLSEMDNTSWLQEMNQGNAILHQNVVHYQQEVCAQKEKLLDVKARRSSEW